MGGAGQRRSMVLVTVRRVRRRILGPLSTLLSTNMVGDFRSSVAASWGVRTDEVLRSVCLASPSSGPGTWVSGHR